MEIPNFDANPNPNPMPIRFGQNMALRTSELSDPCVAGCHSRSLELSPFDRVHMTSY